MDARFFGLLAYVPEQQPGDPPWRQRYARPGDRVLVYSTPARRPDEVNLGTYPVVAASSRHLKLEDGRVFSQSGGWPLYSGRSSPTRARVVR